MMDELVRLFAQLGLSPAGGISLMLAIYSAVLATIGSFLAIKNWRREKQKSERQMFVELTLALQPNPQVDEAGIVKYAYGMRTEIAVSCGNTGHRSVTLAKVGISAYRDLFRGSSVLYSTSRIVDLEPGHRHDFSVDVTILADKARVFAKRNGNIRLVGYYEDALGKPYESRPVRTNVDAWIPSTFTDGTM